MSGNAHKKLAKRCGPWLRGRTTGRGMRCGFEVPLADQYVADWVALCGFQWRIERRYVDERKLQRRNGVLISPEFACVFEVKVSRADFLGTYGPSAKNSLRKEPVGSLHWLVTPRGLVLPGELPPFWGLLETSGAGLHETSRAKYCPITTEQRYMIAYYVLWYGKEYPA